MLQQLQRLSRPVFPAGPDASAIAVYADAADRHVPANEMGFEGVACVDDAARAVVLFTDIWEATRLPAARTWAASLVDFLLYMQLEDGRFVNFIWDWEGRRNLEGPTSFAGGGFWHARGVRGLAKAAVVLGDERAKRGMERGLEHIRSARDVPPDIRAVHAIMTIELIRAGRVSEMRPELERWVDEIAGLRRGAVLFDNPDAAAPHLWGHVQEGVLAEAGALLGRPDLIAIARASALEYLAPLVESGFDLPTVQPRSTRSSASPRSPAIRSSVSCRRRREPGSTGETLSAVRCMTGMRAACTMGSISACSILIPAPNRTSSRRKRSSTTSSRTCRPSSRPPHARRST